MKDIRKFANDLADLIDENDYLKERVAKLELKLAESEARFYGKSGLAEKLFNRHMENLSCRAIASIGGMSNLSVGYIEDIDGLSAEDTKFILTSIR